MAKIKIERRAYDYIGFINGDRKKWEAGKDAIEVMGKLLQSYHQELGLELVLPEVK